RYAGINIHATGSNVITLGDGNLLNAEYSHLHKELNDFKQAIAASPRLSDAEKLNTSVDIESIKDQLAKEKPNKTMIGYLWSGIEKVVTAAGLADAVQKLLPLLKP